MLNWKRKLMLLLLCTAVLFCCGAVQAESAEQDEANVVPVTNVDEFLAAIAPNTQIVMAPGEYNLTQAADYAWSGSEWYHWEEVFDGWELVVTGVSGLTIRGEEPDTVLSTEPRYAQVMRIVDASDIHIEGLTIGHTKEQGSCAGGVLYFTGCRDIEIQGTGLYGCGTLGVRLENCQNFHMDDSEIYECSEGCVSVSESYNVLFENSRFYNCRLWDGVFQIFGSREVAVINSEIFGNRGQDYGFEDTTCLVYSNCQGIYLGGLDVHDNALESLFNTTWPVLVEKSRIEEPTSRIGNIPMNSERELMTEAEFNALTLDVAEWSASARPALPEVHPSEDGKYHVTSVDEFLAAIDNEHTIFLEPGIYDLSTAMDYGSLGGTHYRWVPMFDGVELCISDVIDLTIEGADVAEVTISATPRYANVLCFDNTINLTLRNFTAGHTKEPGSCAGGVILLNSASHTTIEGCSLFGCGILGINAIYCNGLDVLDTEIYECSQGGVSFYSSSGVNMERCDLHDNQGTPIQAYGSGDLTVDGRKTFPYIEGAFVE